MAPLNRGIVMGYELSASQLSEMRKNGFVVFADFISEQDVAVLKHSDGDRDSFQRCPLTKKILANRDLGKLVFELCAQRPLRLVLSKKVINEEMFCLNDVSIDEVYIGMFLSYEDLSVTFFNKDHNPEFESDGMVAVYGNARSRYIQKMYDEDASYLLKKGYASGDKLSTHEYPFIYK